MRTVTLSLASRDAVSRRALNAFAGKRMGAHISFASAHLLWRLLTAKRWELLKAMAGCHDDAKGAFASAYVEMFCD